MVERIHHLFWSVSLVACTALIVFFAVPQLARGGGAEARASALQTEVSALLAVDKSLAAAHGTVPIYQQAAVGAVSKATGGAFTDTAYAAFLTALGHVKTAPAYKVSLLAPTPRPEAPGAPSWHYADTYNATAEALKNTVVNLHVTQDPLPPSRTQSLFLSDKSAGVAFALRRRGQFDFDLGVTQANAGGFEATGGLGYRIRGTQAGLYVGPVFNFGTHKASVAAGLTVAF